jgi:hypothetical protein
MVSMMWMMELGCWAAFSSLWSAMVWKWMVMLLGFPVAKEGVKHEPWFCWICIFLHSCGLGGTIGSPTMLSLPWWTISGTVDMPLLVLEYVRDGLPFFVILDAKYSESFVMPQKGRILHRISSKRIWSCLKHMQLGR